MYLCYHITVTKLEQFPNNETQNMVKDYVGSQVTHQFNNNISLEWQLLHIVLLYVAIVALPDTKRKWIAREWKHSLCIILKASDALTGSGVAEGIRTGLGLDLTTDHSWMAASLLKRMETVKYTNAFTPHSRLKYTSPHYIIHTSNIVP